MKKRNVRRDEPPQKPAKAQLQKKEKTSKSWKKIILLSLAAAAMLGFSVKILPELIQQFALMNRIRLPFFLDLSQPAADFSLNPTVNMYMTSEEGISLGVWSKSWKKIILLSLAAAAMLGFSVKILPELIQQFALMNRIRLPFFLDLSQPAADFSLNHTVNMYMTSEEGISLGVWQTVPESRWKEAQGKGLDWYQKALSDGSPVFIYFHGNTNSRAAPHRIGVSKLLSELGYHVLVPDYRGFGDSTGEPTEEGLTTDALYIYDWVKARSGKSLVVLWGHSLGTGVSTNLAVKLLEKGVVLDGVILEGTFNSAGQKFSMNPFLWFYFSLPGLRYVFSGVENPVFPTEENVKKMKSPILFLHSEDDHLVPIKIVERLHEVAASAQNKDRVKFEKFDGSKGYLHNGLYRDAKLPGVLKHFVESL